MAQFDSATSFNFDPELFGELKQSQQKGKISGSRPVQKGRSDKTESKSELAVIWYWVAKFWLQLLFGVWFGFVDWGSRRVCQHLTTSSDHDLSKFACLSLFSVQRTGFCGMPEVLWPEAPWRICKVIYWNFEQNCRFSFTRRWLRFLYICKSETCSDPVDSQIRAK